MLGAVGDPFAERFAWEEGALLKLLAARNEPILAHGRRPISEGTCREMLEVARRFLIPEGEPPGTRFPRLSDKE